MHAAMIELNLTSLLHGACDVDPDPVLTPADTYQKLLRNGTEKLKFSEAAGRVTGVMLVPYPPGIPVRMPGERLGGPESPTVRLILALQEFGKRFPGFEREVHGIEIDAKGDFWVRTVVDSQGAVRGNGQKEKPPTSAPLVKKRRRTSKAPTPPSGSAK
jgi:arginine decarboxylase